MNDSEILAITRPHANLMKMYFLQALATLIAFPFVIVPLYFKYHTLRYRLDQEGIAASWGLLFRHEVYLTYRRIQDIQIKRNLIERWLGIGTVQVQTASGSSKAELAVEGVADYEAVRDFLYRRMRGHELGADRAAPAGGREDPAGRRQDVVALLGAIRTELDGARKALEERAR